MSLLWKINIDRPVSYYKSGQYVCCEGWKHKHVNLEKDFEIIIGLTDSIFVQLGDKKYTIRHGDVLFIPPGVEHFGYRPSRSETSFFWLHFFPSQTATQYPKVTFIEHLTNLETHVYRKFINDSIFIPNFFHIPSTGKVSILMKQILDITNTDYYSSYAADYLVTELLIELTQQYSKQLLQTNAVQMENTQKFAQILEWIRTNIYEDLSVQQIADAFSFNSDYLTRMFKKRTGMSTIKYIHKLKLDKAKELLCTTNKTIKEIAYELHFKDEKYFMKLFKKNEDMTPSQF